MRHKSQIRLTLKSPAAVNAVLAPRVNDARRAAAQQLVSEVVELVRSLIPNRGGWFTIYREALTYFASADQNTWAASGLWPQEFSAFPADRTLITLKAHAANKIEETLASYNPWTVDQLPSLSGGIRAEASAKPASESEVEAQRARLLDVAPSIKKLILAAGGTYVDDVVTIQGKVYADVAFMARCLEHGLAGFPRIPHWIKVLRYSQNNASEMVEPASSVIRGILAGKETFNATGEIMPPDLERRIGL